MQGKSGFRTAYTTRIDSAVEFFTTAYGFTRLKRQGSKRRHVIVAQRLAWKFLLHDEKKNYEPGRGEQR